MADLESRVLESHVQQLLLLIVFVVTLAPCSRSQSSYDPLSQGNGSQNTSQQQSITTDCSDPALATSPQCLSQTQRPGGAAGGTQYSPGVPILTNSGNYNTDQYVPRVPPLNPSQLVRPPSPPRPETEFEQLVSDSVGRPLPLFGQSLFLQPPSTFSPVDFMQVPSDYIIGPGDELQIKIWGQVQANLRAVVDRSGQIYIPQVGQVTVVGVHYGDLESHLKDEVSKIFKNFNLTVNIGRLRSIQVVVVGDARYPGTYTIGALSTLVNAVFASGGPLPQGSLRDIQVRRDGKTVTDFDFYDLLAKGDKSKDVRLQPGDVIYFPHVGPLVAISGSVNTPAIYEVKEDSTLNDLIEIAGNLSTVADTDKITIERFVNHQSRETLEFPYDAKSRSEILKDGDIVRVFSIVPRFENTVTLRGNVANPGRYPWKPGMKVRDLIPNAQSLLTRRYWRNRAAIVNGRATEYPILPQTQRPDRSNSPQGQSAATRTNEPNNAMSTGGTAEGETIFLPENGQEATAAAALNNQNGSNAQGTEQKNTDQSSSSATPSAQISQPTGSTPNPNAVRDVADDVRRYAPEINWDYAIIQRVNPQDLSSKLIWMSPRKAIIEGDEAYNLELQPGDIVTIFSQRDISVPQSDRSQYVIVEGEVLRPGVYRLETNETIRSVLQRAGGLTTDAYVYGAQFTRESARVDQQKSLDELAQTMEVQIRQSAMAVAASANPGDLPQLLAAQEAIITQLRNTRANGRVALSVKPKDRNIADFPDMIMEDSDRLMIPHTPSTVSVVGDVYNPGSFIFELHNTAGAYLELAGKGKPQSDLHHAFVLRANGVVVSANEVNGVFTGAKFEHIRLYPGDQIVVPYKLPTGAFIRGLRDWTQITSQLAITGAALAIVAP